MIMTPLQFPKKDVSIALVGKYTGLTDSYLSITKALFHAAIESDLKLRIEWIDSSRLEVGHQAKNAEVLHVSLSQFAFATIEILIFVVV
jgi:CTP synthase (UTP-ammonia lyase)